MLQDKQSEYIEIGGVLKAIGLDGLCSVELYGNTLSDADLPFNLFIGKDLQNLRDAVVCKLEQRNKTVVCLFQDVNDRDAAEALRGLSMYIQQERLPSLDENKFYHFELQGMMVFAQSGEQLGVVESVFNYPSTEALEVRLTDRSMVTVPFLPDCIVQVDKKDKRIVINKGFLEEII